MKNVLKKLMLSLCTLVIVSCNDDKENEEPTLIIGDNIVGTWLLSTSDAENWISYEFTQSARINAEIAQSGYYGKGTGYYTLESDKLSGSYTTDRSKTVYVDWVVTAIKPFEISMKIYNENNLLGDASIYRVMSNVELETGSSTQPDYRGLCGSGKNSNFKILDGSIAEINAESGEITAKKEGITFATFTTPNGVAAVRITVTTKIKTFEELLVGTWVYDKPSEKSWERFVFADNGYALIQWTTYDGIYDFNESVQTTYTIDDQTVAMIVTIPQGKMNMRLVTESINDFNWSYVSYDGSYMNGKYTVQRMLESVSLLPKGVYSPDYQTLVGTAEIQSYTSHNEAVAIVSESGEITAKSKGRTYIDVNTDKGSGVIEVNV